MSSACIEQKSIHPKLAIAAWSFIRARSLGVVSPKYDAQSAEVSASSSSASLAIPPRS